MYLFQPRDRERAGQQLSGAANVPEPASDEERWPRQVGPSIQPGSAAEWALGELLIRLCNGGRALRPEPPADDPPE